MAIPKQNALTSSGPGLGFEAWNVARRPASHIFLVGASGVGKTSLAEWIAKRYGIQLLPSPSRQAWETVLHGCAGCAGCAGCDPREIKEAIQIETSNIMATQFDTKHAFVADRSVEILGYTRLVKMDHLLEQMRSGLRQYLGRPYYTHVIWVRPSVGPIARAWGEGRRLEFLTHEMIGDIDRMIGEDLPEVGRPLSRVFQVTWEDWGQRTRRIAEYLEHRGMIPEYQGETEWLN